MRFSYLLLTVFLFVNLVSADPVVVSLRDFLNGTTSNIAGVEDGGNLYLASNDDPNNLKNIQVVTGGHTYLLSDLAKVNPDGTPNKITLNGGLTLTTTNPNAVSYTLTGYLYATTAQQAQDASFSVYVITGSHHINLSGVAATTVILNTQLAAQSGESDQPGKSTYLTNLMMTQAENVYFQYGVPANNYKSVTSNQFFMNPFNYTTIDNNGNPVSTTRLFFDHVEPLQIGLDYWYITSYGPVTMDMQNNYVANHNTTTTSANTTGLLINSNFIYSNHIVNFQSDPTRGRSVGTMITAYLTASVSFVFRGSNGNFVQTYDQTKNTTHLIKTSPVAAQLLNVTASNFIAGTFYCQYFSISTDVLPVVTSTTTTTVPGSTQSTQTQATAESTVSIGTGSTQSTVSGNPTVTTTTPIPGTGTQVSTTTVATTTKSSRSLSIFSAILVVLGFFM